MQPPIQIEVRFLRLAPPRRLATLCPNHCSTCVAQDVPGHDDLAWSSPSSQLPWQSA
ncbi:MAG: hypothetical protein MRERC_9c035 [Mycoplasmataceae bacterium RC_NB112A]|nr:MAG: hypothetical protein MRERC_9c035 [Mycoplasmataceae bacterium RC_NB112A]